VWTSDSTTTTADGVDWTADGYQYAAPMQAGDTGGDGSGNSKTTAPP